MELRQLRYFVAVAEELHFTRAAGRLHIAQPPLSQQIRQLERELDVTLFARTRRRVELTAAGHAFLCEARRVLSASAAAVRATQRASRGETGRLIVGYAGSVGYRLLPEIIREYRAKHPEVELALDELSTVQQLDALATGRIDVGLVRMAPGQDARFGVELLLREPLLAVLPEEHPLARLRRVPLRRLATLPWVFLPRSSGPGLHDQIFTVCRAAGLMPQVVQEVAQISSVVSLVASGVGVSLLPSGVAELGRAGVRYVPLAPPVPYVSAAMIWPLESPLHPTIPPFLAIARKIAATISGPARRRN